MGKWDAGMATMDHIPIGRGYDTSFGCESQQLARACWLASQQITREVPAADLNHANDYYTETAGLTNGKGPVNYANGSGVDVFVDMWDTDRPAHGQNGTGDRPPCGQGYCPPGRAWETDYEEYKFKTRVQAIISAHDLRRPLFMCYTPHLIHAPLEVPNRTYAEFDFITDDFMLDGFPHRHTYHAQVKYLDEVIGVS